MAQTKEILAQGGLVLFPTETTYGAGVDATNQLAVNKLLAYKSRREGKPLSVLVANPEMAGKFVEINDQAQQLYDQFLPGPVTVISKSLGSGGRGSGK
jgi:L-threonylcarbamoyladenylate synthase